ncbi:MAG TPA: hypothetical protein VKV26_00980 [Dehalococcoidia bacterium]|nr:hypothetical protein [Dehalococcoidia bacterium]
MITFAPTIVFAPAISSNFAVAFQANVALFSLGPQTNTLSITQVAGH